MINTAIQNKMSWTCKYVGERSLFPQTSQHGQAYDKVCRTLAQVTISCESENGKTVYNGYHSQFNDKDCEPRGPEHRGRRTSFCFIEHFRLSTRLQGA